MAVGDIAAPRTTQRSKTLSGPTAAAARRQMYQVYQHSDGEYMY